MFIDANAIETEIKRTYKQTYTFICINETINMYARRGINLA